MTYFELVDAVREAYANADASSIKEHIAFQFNVTGEAEGIFYLEIKDGKISVEPYDYHDRDVLFTVTAETLLKIGRGELDPMWAYTTKKLRAEGNLGKALVLKEITPKKGKGAKADAVAETVKEAEAESDAAAKVTVSEEALTEENVPEEAEQADAVESAQEAAEEEALDEEMTAEEEALNGEMTAEDSTENAAATAALNERSNACKKRPNKKSKKKRR